jgi:hypothetical protein
VAAYLGLVPRRDQSGETDKLMRISKAGDTYPRRLPVGAAQSILGPFGPDTALKRKGLKLAERGGPRTKRKAVVAVARNLAVLLLTLWHDEALSEADGLAFPMVPKMVKNGIRPDAEAKAMAEFHVRIAQLLVVFCQIEQAFGAGDMEKVQELVRPIREAKKQGHDSFMEED